jgi:hypothetical protein
VRANNVYGSCRADTFINKGMIMDNVIGGVVNTALCGQLDDETAEILRRDKFDVTSSLLWLLLRQVSELTKATWTIAEAIEQECT